MRLFLFACVGLVAACEGRSNPARIGVIDVTSALRSSQAGVAATALLKEAHARRQQQLDEKQAALKERLAATAGQPASKESELVQQELVSLQTEFARMSEAMSAEQTSAIEALMPPLGKAIEAVAAERKLEVVLDTASVVYRGATVDITDECVRRLDADSK